jgi:hypothetical protein
MNPWGPLSYNLLLARLEEELRMLRNIVPVLEGLRSEESINLFGKVAELFQTCGDILEMLHLEEEKPSPSAIKGTAEPILEFLVLSADAMEKMEKKLPLFLTEVTVFNEPLTEKISQLQRVFFDIVDGKTANPDVEELSFVFREIGQTLEYLNFYIRNLLDRLS